MSKVQRIAGIAIFFGVTFPATGYATECASKLTTSSSVSSIIQCLKDQETEIAHLAAIQPIRGDKGDPGDPAFVPEGAVIAFDRPDRCPPGWANFDEGASRMIVGAYYQRGTGRQNVPTEDENGRRLVAKHYRDVGGEEMHTLTIEEMPTHGHSPPDGYYHWWYKGGGYGNHQITDKAEPENFQAAFSVPATEPSLFPKEAGLGGDHNNMPPYIALYFCKKEGG